MKNIRWFGCALAVFSLNCGSQDPVPVQPDPLESPGAVNHFDLPPVYVRPGKKDTIKGGEKGTDVLNLDPPVVDDSEIPNAILLATCESEPDEVAVPLNAFDDRFCDTVQAFAYRADAEGAYEVSANYYWSVADESVAQILPLPGKEHGGVQRPSVAYDILWAEDQAQEPQTSITVCVEPKNGWPPGHPALCRSLPLFAVVNLDGAWCFSGATFQSDCDDQSIVQDGRFLKVGADGQGTIYGKDVTFYGGNMEFFYQAVLSSHDAMSGIVRDAYTDDELGSWSAWKLPLP
ncbi:MAG: hypothetical protein PHC70_00270 [Patescibacteria group bacterium]|nr:hypothetical protein [Patescibacteria group bacterium]